MGGSQRLCLSLSELGSILVPQSHSAQVRGCESRIMALTGGDMACLKQILWVAWRSGNMKWPVWQEHIGLRRRGAMWQRLLYAYSLSIFSSSIKSKFRVFWSVPVTILAFKLLFAARHGQWVARGNHWVEFLGSPFKWGLLRRNRFAPCSFSSYCLICAMKAGAPAVIKWLWALWNRK